jgi:ferredoxin--NADP+ reductase
VISREEFRGALHGRITELIVSGELERFAGGRIDPESSHVMMCGNPGMIEEGKRILEKRGLKRHYSDAPGQYSVEDYQ